MFGEVLGDSTYGAYEQEFFFGIPAQATVYNTSTSPATFSEELLASHNDKGDAHTVGALREDSTLPVVTAPLPVFYKTVLVEGQINPFLYDTTLYDARIYERGTQSYTLTRAAVSVHSVQRLLLTTSDVVPGGEIGKSKWVDYPAELRATEHTPLLPQIFEEPPNLVEGFWGQLHPDKDDLVEYTPIGTLPSKLEATEGFYNPPQSWFDVTASLPGVRTGSVIDGHKYAMIFKGNMMQARIMPLDLVTVPSGDVTGLNNVWYAPLVHSGPMVYGFEHVYAERDVLYTGRIYHRTVYIDRHHTAYKTEFSSGKLCVHGDHPVFYVDYQFALHQPVVTTDLKTVPTFEQRHLDPREGIMYGTTVYAEKYGLYSGIRTPDTVFAGTLVVGSAGTLYTKLHAQAFNAEMPQTIHVVFDKPAHAGIPDHLARIYRPQVHEVLFDGAYDSNVDLPVFTLRTENTEEEHRVPQHALTVGRDFVFEAVRSHVEYSEFTTDKMVIGKMIAEDTYTHTPTLATQVTESTVKFAYAGFGSASSWAITFKIHEVRDLDQFYASSARVAGAHTVYVTENTISAQDSITLPGQVAPAIAVQTHTYAEYTPLIYAETIVGVDHVIAEYTGTASATPFNADTTTVIFINKTLYTDNVFTTSAVHAYTAISGYHALLPSVDVFAKTLHVRNVFELRPNANIVNTSTVLGEAGALTIIPAAYLCGAYSVLVNIEECYVAAQHVQEIDIITATFGEINYRLQPAAQASIILETAHTHREYPVYDKNTHLSVWEVCVSTPFIVNDGSDIIECNVHWADVIPCDRFPIILPEPTGIWFEVEIEYDYSQTDPGDIAFIF